MSTIVDVTVGCTRPVAEGGGGAGRAVPPPTGNKLKTCPTKPTFALANFNHLLPKIQMTLVYFKMKCPF